MNRISKNHIFLLVCLVALWIGLLIWQFGYSTEPQRVPLTHVSGTKAEGRATAAPATGSLQVHLERLAAIKGQRQATFFAPRNIFGSLLPPVEPVSIPEPAPARRSRTPRKPAPPTDIPPDPAPSADVEPEPEENKGPTPEDIERLKIATELNLYRYVGFMTVGSGTQKKKSMAVVIKDEEMHLLQLGDTIAGQVLVKAVSPSEITLQHVASKITQVIPATDEPAATGEKPN
ncbi:MAG TPA: hypothetical protein VM842_00305 [Nitrospira sp.]|nr:hypothetical protein [Nitrospira sp.]